MFSIVIPYYNHKYFILDTIRSLEDNINFINEVIIIDDGSKDGGIAILEEKYSGSIKSLLKFYTQENKGAHVAINRGVDLCKSEYIAILNSDDMFSSNKLEICKNIFQENEHIDLVWGKVEFIDINSNPLESTKKMQWYINGLNSYKNYSSKLVALIEENIAVSSSNMVFKKSKFEEIGGFRNFRYANDLDFLLRFIKNNNYYFDEKNIHIKYRYHDNNTISENIHATTSEVHQIVSELYNFIENCSDINDLEFRQALINRGLTSK